MWGVGLKIGNRKYEKEIMCYETVHTLYQRKTK